MTPDDHFVEPVSPVRRGIVPKQNM